MIATPGRLQPSSVRHPHLQPVKGRLVGLWHLATQRIHMIISCWWPSYELSTSNLPPKLAVSLLRMTTVRFSHTVWGLGSPPSMGKAFLELGYSNIHHQRERLGFWDSAPQKPYQVAENLDVSSFWLLQCPSRWPNKTWKGKALNTLQTQLHRYQWCG